jgi:ABC-type sugar transport system ATPase subunit
MSDLELALHIQKGALRLSVEASMSSGIHWLCGPSGVGKTTVLRIIAGLERPDSGTVRFGSELWTSDADFVPAHKRGSPLVFQSAKLFPHLSVRDNLLFGVQSKAHTMAIAGNELSKLAAAWQIVDLLSRPSTALSGGEAQRIAIVRALVTKPKPFSAQSDELAAVLMRELEKLAVTIPVVIAAHHDPTGSAFTRGTKHVLQAC